MKTANLLVLIIALLLVFILPDDGFYADDNGIRSIQVQSLILHNFNDFSLVYPSKDIDPDFNWIDASIKLSVYDNQLYSIYPPLFPLLAAFLYVYVGNKAFFLLPMLFFFISILIFQKILDLMMERNVPFYLFNFGYIFASPLILYSCTFWEHTAAIAFVNAGLYFLTVYFLKSPKRYHLFFSSFFFGVSLFFRSELMIFVGAYLLVFSIYFVLNQKFRDLLYLIAGLLVPLILFLWMNTIIWGNLLGLHVKFGDTSQLTPSVILRVSFFFFLLITAVFLMRHNKVPIDLIEQSIFICWFGYFLFLISNSPVYSLCIQFPMWMLFFWCSSTGSFRIPIELKEFKSMLVVISVLYVTTVGILFYDFAHIDIRYLLVIVPLLFIYLATDSRKLIKEKSTITVFLLLLIISFATSSFRFFNIVEKRNFNHERVSFLKNSTIQDDVIIFLHPSLMEHTAPLFFERRFLVSVDDSEFKSIASTLQRKKIKQFYLWHMRGWTDAKKLNDLIDAYGFYHVETKIFKNDHVLHKFLYAED